MVRLRKIAALLTALALCSCVSCALADEADQAVWRLPNKSRQLSGLQKITVKNVSQVTGENSPNHT